MLSLLFARSTSFPTTCTLMYMRTHTHTHNPTHIKYLCLWHAKGWGEKYALQRAASDRTSVRPFSQVSARESPPATVGPTVLSLGGPPLLSLPDPGLTQSNLATSCCRSSSYELSHPQVFPLTQGLISGSFLKHG